MEMDVPIQALDRYPRLYRFIPFAACWGGGGSTVLNRDVFYYCADVFCVRLRATQRRAAQHCAEHWRLLALDFDGNLFIAVDYDALHTDIQWPNPFRHHSGPLGCQHCHLHLHCARSQCQARFRNQVPLIN